MPTPVVFANYKLRQHNGNAIDLDTDVIKVALHTNAWTPNVTTDTLQSGLGNECTAGGNYAAGGPAIAGAAIALDGNNPEWTHDDVVILQHASNPTNARYAVWYKSADSRLIMYMDLGAVYDLTTGNFTLDVTPANGVLLIS